MARFIDPSEIEEVIPYESRFIDPSQIESVEEESSLGRDLTVGFGKGLTLPFEMAMKAADRVNPSIREVVEKIPGPIGQTAKVVKGVQSLEVSPERESSLPYKVAEGVGTFVPGLASAALTGGLAAPVILGAGMGAEGGLERAEQFEKDTGKTVPTSAKATSAAIGGVIGGLGNAVPGAAIISKGLVGKAVEGKLANAVGEGVLNSAVGGASQYAENVSDKNLYNENLDTKEGVGTAALVGGIVGVGAGAIGGKSKTTDKSNNNPEPVDTNPLDEFLNIQDQTSQEAPEATADTTITYLKNQLAQLENNRDSVEYKILSRQLKQEENLLNAKNAIGGIEAQIQKAEEAGVYSLADTLMAEKSKLEKTIETITQSKVEARKARALDMQRKTDMELIQRQKQERQEQFKLDEEKFYQDLAEGKEVEPIRLPGERDRTLEGRLPEESANQVIADKANSKQLAEDMQQSGDTRSMEQLRRDKLIELKNKAIEDQVARIEQNNLYKFSRGGVKPEVAIDAAKLNTLTSEFNSKISQPAKTVIVERQSDLPPEALSGLKPGEVVKAATAGDSVYLVRENLANEADVGRALLHETVGHVGVERVFGNELNTKLDQLINSNRALIVDTARQLGIDTTTQDGIRLAAKEHIARLAEVNPKHGLVKKVALEIKSLLRKAGLDKYFSGLKMSDADIVKEFITPSRKSLEKVSNSLGESVAVKAVEDLKVQSSLKPSNPFENVIDSVVDVLRRSPITKELGDRVDFQRGRQRVLEGNLMNSAGEEVFNLKDTSYYTQFFDLYDSGKLQEAKQLFSTASRESQVAITKTVKTLKDIGQKLEALGHQVYDARSKTYKPFKTSENYFPRVLAPKWSRVLDNPAYDPVAWEQLVGDLQRLGIVKTAKEAEDYLTDYVSFSRRTSDRLGNIELSRMGGLPSYVYSFDPAALNQYLRRSADRISQIEAYGQKTKDTKEMFEEVLSKPLDLQTRQYVKQVRDFVYHLKDGNPIHTLNWLDNTMSTATSIAAGNQLGNPGSAIRDLQSIALLSSRYGVTQTLKAMNKAAQTYKLSTQEIKRVGMLKSDFARMFSGDSDFSHLDPTLGKLFREGANKYASVMMKIGGKEFAETYTRNVAYHITRDVLMDILPKLRTNSLKTKEERRQGKALVERLARVGNIDLAKLEAELPLMGKQPTDTADLVVQKLANQDMFSYDIDNLPLWTNNNVVRVVTQYMRWPLQVTHLLHKEFLSKIADKKLPSAERLKAFQGLTTYILFNTAAAFGINSLLSTLFNYNNPMVDVDRLFNYAWDERDEIPGGEQAYGLFYGMLKTIMLSQAFGIYGNVGQTAEAIIDGFEDPRQYGKMFNPFSPPSLSILAATLDGINRKMKQGELSERDVEELVTKQQSLIRALDKITINFGLQGDYRKQAQQATNDYFYARGLIEEYADASGIEKPDNFADARGIANLVGLQGISTKRRTYMTPTLMNIREALLVGDRAQMNKYLNEFFSSGKFTNEEKLKGVNSILRSVKGSDPLFIPGTKNTPEDEKKFKEWASSRISNFNMKRINDITSTYRESLKDLNNKLLGYGITGNENFSEQTLEKKVNRVVSKINK